MMNRFCLVVWFVFWGMCVSPLTADDTVGGTADNTADNAAPASIVAIDVGIAGLYKNGCWTPIAVDTRNAGHEHRFRIETVDGDGVPTVYEFPGRKGSGAVRNVFYIKPGRATAPLGIKLLDVSGAILDSHLIAPKGAFGKTKRPVPAPYLTAGVPTGTRSRSAEVSVRFTEPVPMARPIYLVVGNENIGLQDAVAGLHLSENRRPVLAGLAPDAVWPDRSLGYEAIDMVVLTTREPFGKDGFPDEKGRAGNKRDASGRDEDRRNDANHPAMRALETWMLHGGHVFLVAGKDAEHYLQADRAFAAFLPGTFENMTDVRQGEILQLFAGSRRPLIMSGSEETPFLRTPYFRKQADGSVLLNDGDLPLAMRCAKGFGRLTYFGGDLAADPLLSWRDRHLLLSTILAWKNEQAIPGSNRPVIMMHYGYGDLAGQLRSSLEQFEGTRAVSFSLILIVMAGYVVAVGGLDWLLVHKFLGRPALTWLTFPLWVALFGMIAYGLGVGNRLDTAVVNQVDLLDIDVPGGHVRQSRWFSLYSPADARYDLTVRPSSSFSAFGADSPDSPDFHGSGTVDLLTWNGLSGSGLGGMAPQAYAPGVWQEGYGIDVGARDAAAENGLTHDRTRGVTGGAISTPGLRGLPVAVRSTKSLFMQTFSRTSMKDSRAAPDDTAGTSNRFTDRLSQQAAFREEQGIPVGELHNPLDVPLQEVRLAFGRWTLDVGRIEARATVRVGPGNPRYEMRDILYEKMADGTGGMRNITSYGTHSKNPLYILRTLTLYDAVGGFEAIGLQNEYQHMLGMSNLLKTDRVILIAKAYVDRRPMRSSSELFDAGRPLPLGWREQIVRMVLPITLEKRRESSEPESGGALETKVEGIRGPEIEDPFEKGE